MCNFFSGDIVKVFNYYQLVFYLCILDFKYLNKTIQNNSNVQFIPSYAYIKKKESNVYNPV